MSVHIAASFCKCVAELHLCPQCDEEGTADGSQSPLLLLHQDEPHDYSIDDLEKEGTAEWDGMCLQCAPSLSFAQQPRS